MYPVGKENIFADTLSHAYLEEMTDGKPEEELTAQLWRAYGENAPATKSRLEEIREETVKNPRLKTVTKYIIEGWSRYQTRQNQIGHSDKSYQSLMGLYLKAKCC